MQAPDPLLDPARLAALRELDLLSSRPQDSISRLNRLAAQVLGVPISALSLISWDRQVTAGINGPPEDAAELIDTPLSHSFCQHVVRAGEPYVVNDARLDPLVATNGSVADSGILSYAGVPIRLAGGECVGAFCACDLQAREWTETDLDTLSDLAAVAVDLLELHRARRDGGMRDALTGLPRRALFTERVQDLINVASDRGGHEVALVAVDLRAFRLFNEAWGHETGDQILTEVAHRLRDTVGSQDLVCRLGGDEFLVAQGTGESAEALSGRLRQMLTVPAIQVEGTDQPVTATFVTATYSEGTDARDFIDDALTNLAATKRTEGVDGGGPNFVGPARRRLRLRNAIVGAETRNELSLQYQPLVDLATGEVHSFEALMRWDHPELGSVSPRDFIPVAESTGAIVPMGEWVLRQACRDLAGWRKHHTGNVPLTVAVNVAPEQVRVPSFEASVASALESANLPASALALEITERTILEDRPNERRTIDALQLRGVDLHLDDFGTGYSSLGYLTRFPVDVLKIDRVFVSRLGLDNRATALVEGIIAMAHSLGLATVAEGIEHEHQRDMLTAMGCNFGQGFYFARPCPGERVPEMLRQFAG